MDTELFSPPELTFPATRADALRAWERFLPRAPAYAAKRNVVRTGAPDVSRLSPAIRARLITEDEIIRSVLAAHPFSRVEKFVQEVCWRRYWKSWLELRPSVWSDYREAVGERRRQLKGYQARRVEQVEAGESGVEIMDHFAREIVGRGYLHNHARMWFAGFWVHVEQLPWELGADFFYRNLLDADPASNTLSWRWVAGIQTRGKAYLVRRSNLENNLDPALLAAHPGGLDRLEDKLARPARVFAPDHPVPDNAELDATPTAAPSFGAAAAAPDAAGTRLGVWVHGDDLSVESSPLASLRPHAVGAAVAAGLLRDFSLGPRRREYLPVVVRDGLTRAAAHFGVEPVFTEADSLPEALASWAASGRLTDVAALRPTVGPLADALPAVRTRLGSAGVRLHLVRRPEDAATLPFAKSGYFAFWERMRLRLDKAAAAG